MWTRKELKDKAKISFKANYWKSVIVGLLLVVISVGVGGFSAPAGNSVPGTAGTAVTAHDADDVNVEVVDGKVVVDVDGDGGKVHVNVDADDAEELRELAGELESMPTVRLGALSGAGMALFGISVALLMLVALAVSLVLSAFVLGPLEVGAQRFFLRDLNQQAEVREVAYAFDTNYAETVKAVFLRSLFVFLWSLLLVVPGIYKSYEYRMIPYLMADDPTMTKDRAFAESKRMMDGQKWNAFVLDLSFLGWNILSVLTLGILGVFYVTPYQAHANAALYEKLRYGLPAPDASANAAPAGYWQQPVAPQPPVAGATAWVPGATAPMPAQAQATSPMAAAPHGVAVATTPDGADDALSDPMPPSGTSGDAPRFAPASQPPVPPFAAIGYAPDEAGEDGDDGDAAAGDGREA